MFILLHLVITLLLLSFASPYLKAFTTNKPSRYLKCVNRNPSSKTGLSEDGFRKSYKNQKQQRKMNNVYMCHRFLRLFYNTYVPIWEFYNFRALNRKRSDLPTFNGKVFQLKHVLNHISYITGKSGIMKSHNHI